MLEIRDEFEAENEKTELGVLVDVIDEQLDYFNQDKDFDKEVADAVQEIEITPEHPCPNCKKICKSKGGLTRHMRSKHTLVEANDGDSTAAISKAVVEDLFKKANSKIKDNLYGEEIVTICTNLKPSSLCVDVLGKLHQRFNKKSNQDSLVSELYKHLSKEPEKLVNQPSDKRWSVEQVRIAVNLLFIHLPELLIVATCKSQSIEQTKDVPEVNEREHGPLSYLMGSVISKMFRTSKFRKRSMLESTSTNKEELQDLLQSMKQPDNEYILSLSRGGLWTPCEDLIAIGFEIEKTFRYETVAFDVTKPVPISELQTCVLENPKVKSL